MDWSFSCAYNLFPNQSHCRVQWELAHSSAYVVRVAVEVRIAMVIHILFIAGYAGCKEGMQCSLEAAALFPALYSFP